MSVTDPAGEEPIAPDSPLGRALGGYRVPAMSADFADRVLAAAEARPAPLPGLRRRVPGGRRWRAGRRIAIGIASFGALATAAAATGLLEQLDIPVPSAGTVWAAVTGSAPEAVPPIAAADKGAGRQDLPTPIAIEGPIDTPEELQEAFRRIDEVRQGRRETRRQFVDQRIDRELERRRAAGLPVPTAEEEARIRQRIEQARTLRDRRIEGLVDRRRADMERKVESGEPLTRGNVLGPPVEGSQALQRRERLERLRGMSPEERRARIEEWRQRLAERLSDADPAASPTPVGPEPAAPDEGLADPPM